MIQVATSGTPLYQQSLRRRGIQVASTGVSITRYRAAVLADSPVAYWRLAEASGTSAADSVGTFTGTYMNSPTLGAASAISDTGDHSVTFVAASSNYMTAAVPTAVTDNYSLEAWVKLPSVTAQRARIVANGDTGGTTGWGFAMASSTMGGTGFVLVGNMPGVGNFSSNYTFADTNWHHIVMVREAGTSKFYVDAALQTGTSVSVPNAPTTAFQVAKSTFEGTFFDGSVDEVAAYATALSAARVSAHYAAR